MYENKLGRKVIARIIDKGVVWFQYQDFDNSIHEISVKEFEKRFKKC